jgi:hypothetical protein
MTSWRRRWETRPPWWSCPARTGRRPAPRGRGRQAGGLRGERERDQVGHVGGVAETTQRDRLRQVVTGLVGHQAGHVARADSRARGHRVDGDAEAGGLNGQRLDEPVHSRPGQRVMSRRRVVVLAADRGHGDDPARAAPHHGGRRRPAQVQHPVQAGVDDRAPLGFGHLGQRPVPGDAGAAHQGVHRTKLVLGAGEPLRNLGGQPHVDLGGEDPGAELAGCLLGPDRGQLVVAIAEGDVPAFGRQPVHDGRTDATGPVADQHNPAVIVAHCAPSPDGDTEQPFLSPW